MHGGETPRSWGDLQQASRITGPVLGHKSNLDEGQGVSEVKRYHVIQPLVLDAPRPNTHPQYLRAHNRFQT